MDPQPPAEARTVAARLRAVVYTYVAANLAVALLLLSTVTPTPPPQTGWASLGHSQVASR